MFSFQNDLLFHRHIKCNLFVLNVTNIWIDDNYILHIIHTYDSTIVNTYKVKQDPLYRAVKAWNNLPVYVRNANTKESLRKMVISTVPNPYAK